MAKETTAPVGFTPGPWEYDADHDGGGTPLGAWRVDPAGTTESEAWENGPIAETIHREEDARLIALAPEMVEALRITTDFLGGMHFQDGAWVSKTPPVGAMDFARALLARVDATKGE